MLTKRIIPCLDVDAGRVVKGVRFTGLRVAGDPVELAAYYDREGADELVFYDITASAEGRKTMVEVVARTADQVFIPLTVGGGLRTIDDMRLMLRSGADKVSINTAAIEDPTLLARGAAAFRSKCVVLSIDAKTEGDRPRGHAEGGRRSTALDTVEWARRGVELGAGEVVLNSIDTDGTRAGYDLRILRLVSEAVQVPVIASGGAGSLEHLYLAVAEGKADAVLAASIFHYREVTIAEAKRFLAARGIPVRL